MIQNWELMHNVGWYTIQLHEYDGMFRRLKTSGTLFFWSDAWQVLEKKPASSSGPRFVYIRGVVGYGELIKLRKIT